MKSLRMPDRRAGSALVAILTLFGMMTPALVPVFTSAATLTSRSIAMSSSATSATGVQYTVTFTTSAATRAVDIDFCSDSPIINTTCTAPTGFVDTGAVGAFTSSGAANIPGGTITYTSATANHFAITGTSASSATGTFVFTISGITNSSTLGSFYARIYTYAAATSYVAANNLGTPLDSGGVAMSTTNTIGVSAAVRETMTFCVTTVAPTAACGNAGTSTPGITLGHGSPSALDATATDTASNNALISTNAATGAIVYMTNSNTACGGLRRVSAGVATCDIAPQTTSAAAATILGTAKFGMNVGTANTSISGATGTINGLSPYSTASQYAMNWVSGNATGVGSTYGDPIFNTNSLPVSNVYVPLTFAASVSNSTPAGQYSANINLVATGTF